MILYKNSVIKLDYNPATDIVHVQYPDLYDYLLPEIIHSINILIDTVRNYDIKYLLLDGRQTVSATKTEEGREIALHLAASLAKTRLTKLARLQSYSPEVEDRAKANVKAIHSTMALPYELKDFTDEGEALAWLAHL